MLPVYRASSCSRKYIFVLRLRVKAGIVVLGIQYTSKSIQSFLRSYYCIDSILVIWSNI